MRIPAFVTRVGIFKYRLDDGSTVRELRSPAEVFSEDSLASLRNAPVTYLHPQQQLVGTANYRELARGHVAEASVRQDGDKLAAELIVNDAETVKHVDSGDAHDISCGYRCDVDRTPGAWNGQPYDQLQTNIRYNHVAMGPKGWGRAGAEVSLRLDAGDAVMFTDNEPAPARVGGRPMKMKMILVAAALNSVRIDNTDFPLKGADEVRAAERAFQQAQTHNAIERVRNDMDPEAVKASLEEAMGTIATLQQQLMAAAVAATNPAAAAPGVTAPPADAPTTSALPDATVLDELLAKRAKLLDRAKLLAPEVKLDSGVNERAIMVATIKARSPETVIDDMTDIAFVRGAFEVIQPPAATRTDGFDAAAKASLPASRTDAAGPKSEEQMRLDNRQALSERWKTKLEAVKPD